MPVTRYQDIRDPLFRQNGENRARREPKMSDKVANV